MALLFLLRWRAIAVLAGVFLAATALAYAIVPVFLPVRPVPIHVRWKADVTEARRLEFEHWFQLTAGLPTEGQTWSYELKDPSTATIRALIQDPAVDDTAGLNRVRFRPQLSNDRPRLIVLYAVAAGGAALLLVIAMMVASRAGAASMVANGARLARSYPGSRGLALGLTAGGLGAFSFTFRFLTLRDFPNDHYMYLAWAQQLLFGGVPGRDFVEPGYLLTYSLSALVQRGWPGPLSEALLTIAMLSIAIVFLVLVVERITGSIVAAAVAGATAIAIEPQLYNYPKLIAPVVALWLLAQHEAAPTRGRRAALAVWTTLAFLFRHDLGIYVAIATIVGLTVERWRTPRVAIRHLGEYLAVGLITVVPYLVFIAWADGIPEHVRRAIEFSKNETTLLRIVVPEFDFGTLSNGLRWTADDSLAALFYLSRVFVLLGVVTAFLRRRQQRSGTIAVVSAAVVLLVAYDLVILRHPIVTRIRDLAVPMTVVGVWTCWEIGRASFQSRTSRRAWHYPGALLAVALVVVSLGSVAVFAKVGEQVRETRILDGWAKTRERAVDVVSRMTSWPWPRFWPNGELPIAIDYIGKCTAPSDQLLVTWPATEYYF